MFRPVPLPDGSYSDDARSFVAQVSKNMIRINAEQPGARSPFEIRTVPGLLPVCERADTRRQRGAYVVEGRLVVVMDQSLILVDPSTFGMEDQGTIPGNGRISASHNFTPNGNETFITNGTQGFIWNNQSQDLDQVTDEGFRGGLGAVFIGQRFVTLDPARRFFQPSDLADGLSWNSTTYELGESDPDRIRALVSINNELVLLSERTIEHFAYTGTENELFANKGISIRRGCVSTHAAVVMDNAIFFPGDDGGIYEKRGYELKRISHHGLEQHFSRFNLKKSYAFSWEDRGHKVYYLTLPDGGGTWGYNLATRTWHQRESYGMDRWRLAWCLPWNNAWYGGEYNGGRIFKLDWDYPLEGSDPLSQELGSGVLHNDGNRMFLHSVRLNVEAGPSVEPVTVEAETPVTYIETMVQQGGQGWLVARFNTVDNTTEVLAYHDEPDVYYQSHGFKLGDYYAACYAWASETSKAVAVYSRSGSSLTLVDSIDNDANREFLGAVKLSNTRFIALWNDPNTFKQTVELCNFDGAAITVVDSETDLTETYGTPDYLTSCLIEGQAIFLLHGELEDRFMVYSYSGF